LLDSIAGQLQLVLNETACHAMFARASGASRGRVKGGNVLTGTLVVRRVAFQHVARNFNPISEILLGENAANVVLDGSHAYSKLGGNLFVAQASRDAKGDSPFGAGQLFVARSVV
jgi:hypothetical protein